MICTTCGADNPGQLTFCQECGQRLAPRVAPPTPPIGLSPPAGALSPLAATALAPPDAPKPVASPSIRPRPPAPVVSFAPKEPSPPPPAAAALAPSPAPRPAGASPCPQCGSGNQPGMRFCVTCGALLIAPPQPGAQRSGPAIDLSRTVPDPPSFDPAMLARGEAAAPPPAPPAAPAIAPGRVMDLGTPQPQAFQRICPRCRGACDSGSQFCRFCGASLADAQAFPLQPAPNPIAAAPTAPVAPAAPAPPPPRSMTPVARIVAAAPVAPPAMAAPAVLAPAPAASVARARLVLIARDGGEGPSFPLGETTDIGRSEGNIVIAEDRYISPRHARISLRQGVFTLRDLESTNGMYVRIPFPRGLDAAAAGAVPPPPSPPIAGSENQASAEQVVTDQDLFLVGQQVLRFEVVKNAEEGFGVASENGTLLFGTPAAPRYARLSQRTVEGVVRDVFHVRKAETVIGREQGDIVFNDDPFLSRRHCVLRVHGGGGVAGAGQGPRTFALADLGSSNGTFLQVREEVRLRHGDHFRIGQQLFRFDT